MKPWLLAVMLLSACAAERRGEERAEQPAARVWIARAQTSHARAEHSRDAAALEELSQAAATVVPATIAESDAVLARQDLYAHAASLALELGRAEQAALLVQQGLALAPYPGPFRAQLFIVASRVKSALGDSAGADADKRAARDAL